MDNAIMLAALFIGLAAGNFGWQAFTNRAWSVAVERTYFQGAALLIVAIIPSA